MPKIPKDSVSNDNKPKKSPTARSAEAREKQMITLAVDLVEKRLREGTASSQETVHYLRQGSITEKLNREKLKAENDLLRAKTKALKSVEEIEQLYLNATKAMSIYNGQETQNDLNSEMENDGKDD